MDAARFDEMIDTAVSHVQRDAAADPLPLTFLLRCYAASDRADLRDVLEPALAIAVERSTDPHTTIDTADWLVLFSDALSLSSDARLQQTIEQYAATLRREWNHPSEISSAAKSVDACLHASRSAELGSLVADAVDELERIVAAAYRPGEGLASPAGRPSDVPARVADHVNASAALLTAFDVTGRLPYSMLAEELMQFTRRTAWNSAEGRFETDGCDAAIAFVLNCDAVRVCCGLAALHEDERYQADAVISPDADYRETATRILDALADEMHNSSRLTAAYGLALIDWLALR